LERKVCQRKPSRGGRRVAGRPAERANVIEEPLRPPQDATTAVRRRAAWELYNERQPVQAVGWRGDLRAHWLEPRWSTVQSVEDWSAEQSPPVALPQNPLRVLVKHFASAEAAAEAAAAVNTTAAAIEAALHPAKTDTPTAASHSSESTPLQEEIVLQPFTGTVVSPPFARPELYLNAGGAVWCMDACAGPQGQQLLAVGIEVSTACSMSLLYDQSACHHSL
jgi:hypothetical protein